MTTPNVAVVDAATPWWKAISRHRNVGTRAPPRANRRHPTPRKTCAYPARHARVFRRARLAPRARLALRGRARGSRLGEARQVGRLDGVGELGEAEHPVAVLVAHLPPSPSAARAARQHRRRRHASSETCRVRAVVVAVVGNACVCSHDRSGRSAMTARRRGGGRGDGGDWLVIPYRERPTVRSSSSG